MVGKKDGVRVICSDFREGENSQIRYDIMISGY